MTTEQYKEVVLALRTNTEASTRLDERVKALVDRLHHFDELFKVVLQQQNEINIRLGILESKTKEFEDGQSSIDNLMSRLSHVERTANTVEDRWKKVFGFVFQGITTILICWALWRFGLSTPPLP